MKNIWRNSLCGLLAVVLLLSVLSAGVWGSNADDETTQFPTVDKDSETDVDWGEPSEDETGFLLINSPGESTTKVLYSWTPDLLDGSDAFSSNLTDDSDERQRWDETAVMYTQQEKKTVTIHGFLNERVVAADGGAYGLPEQTTIDVNIESIKENKERIEDQYGRTAVENLKVDVYPMVDIDNLGALGLSFVYAYKPGDKALNPANSGMLRVYASEDGKTWSNDYVSVRSAHILGSGTDANGEKVIYYQIFTENLMTLSGLDAGDTIAVLRIMPDGEVGIAGGSFGLCSLKLTGYGTEEAFREAVAAETVDTVDIDACRTAVLNAYKSSGESGLNRVLDAISLVTRTKPATIQDMLDTVGLRFMDGIAFNANEKVIQIFMWMIENNLRDAENCEQILADYENITTTEKLLRELNTPQQVFKAYAKCQAGDLLVQVTATGANQVYMIAQSDPVLSAGGNIVIYDDATVKADETLENSTLTYLDGNGEQVTDTFFNLYTQGFAPMVVDVLADEAVQPVRVDGHVSVADGVRVAVSSDYDIEKIELAMEGIDKKVITPSGTATVYTDASLDDFVAGLEAGTYKMQATVYIGAEVPVSRELAFEIKENTITPVSISASFQGLVHMNLYLELSRFVDTVQEEDVGLLVWSTNPGSVEQAKAQLDKAIKVQGASKDSSGRYVVHTNGIPAPELGDIRYMLAYVDMGNGVYAYANKIVEYSPAQYAKACMSDAQFEDVAVSMLNYGAAAQMYFGYRVDALMNADLTEDQKTLNWDSALLSTVSAVPTEKAGEFVRDETVFTGRNVSISLDGAIDLNFYFTVEANQNVKSQGILYWNAADYDAADVLTRDNATAELAMAKVSADQYRSNYKGIPAAEMERAVYACAYVETQDGQYHYSGVFGMSPEDYAKRLIEHESSSDSLVEWMKRMVVYGENAKLYWQ